ncbi:hypothetical protein HPB49_019856 [Dermacentor silvarum]|uniref:Uncharacterized protein n=1 Tax=Dermacentor silvarum TaxID=543639 RepID=A0ACB8E307_DERSI|nr:hypothetical protein HPB49_019856 [Dermacentor silvarum]
MGESPELVPEPFQGRLLSERYPSELPPVYTPEEDRILCPLCRVPEISWRAHHAGSLHGARLTAAGMYHPGLQPPVPGTVEAAIALLRSLRPHLLRDDVLDAHQEHPPGTEPEPQAPLEVIISLELDPWSVGGGGGSMVMSATCQHRCAQSSSSELGLHARVTRIEP